MNISLAVSPLSTSGKNICASLFRSSVDYIYENISDRETGKERFIDGHFLFNSGKKRSAWKVPVWIETSSSLFSFSAPPIPLDRHLPDDSSAYTEYICNSFPDDIAKLNVNPGYWGAAVKGGRLHAWTDIFGLGRSYYVQTEDFFAMSNHIGILTFFCDQIDIDEMAWQQLNGIGWFCEDRSPIVGVRRAPPGCEFIVEQNQVFIRNYAHYKDYVSGGRPSNFSAAAKALKLYCYNAKKMFSKTPRVFLSGGKDSRVTAAAWLASGVGAPITTFNTLEQEGVVASELMYMASQKIDFERLGITHDVVKNRRSSTVTQPAEVRLRNAMLLWDGDHAPNRMMNAVQLPQSDSPIIGGGGGEIGQPYYYKSVEILQQIELSETPLDRLTGVFVKKSTLPHMKENILAYVSRLEGRCADAGVSGAARLNFFYLIEKYRRWTSVGHQTGSLALFANPTFITESFCATAQDRMQDKVHKSLLKEFIPGWESVPFYKGAPKDALAKTHAGLRLWQTDADYTKDVLQYGNTYQNFWNKEVVKKLLDTNFENTLDAHEAMIQKILWTEAFRVHIVTLKKQVNSAKDRARNELAVSSENRSILE